MTREEYEKCMGEFYSQFHNNTRGLEDLQKKTFETLEAMKKLNRECVGLIPYEAIDLLTLRFGCMIKALAELKNQESNLAVLK